MTWIFHPYLNVASKLKKENSMDKTIETILEVANEMSTGLSEKLIKDYYQLHKDNQFNEERSLVLGKIRKLIEDAIQEEKSGEI